jgi:PKHD-type hydroxylase
MKYTQTARNDPKRESTNSKYKENLNGVLQHIGNIDYYTWDHTLSDAECNFLIQDCGKAEAEEGVIQGSARKALSKIRKTSGEFDPDVVWVDHTKMIRNAMINFMEEANKNFFKYDITRTQQIQFVTYEKGDHYVWHKDGVQGDKQLVRKLSLVILLSDPDSFEGGELEFFNGDHGVFYPFKKRGSIICFNSFDWHRVKPVTKGVRHTLVQWSLGPRLR